MPEQKRSYGLGRIAAPDERDQRFLIRAVADNPSPLLRRKYHNANGWWGDQNTTSQCVAYSFVHWLEDGPITQPGAAPIIDPAILYKAAQEEDEWEGTDYEGTSVRAGAKVLKDLGYIDSYYWGYTLQDLIKGLFLSPVVVGTNWYSDMFDPDPRTFQIKVGGELQGGHAWLINGVNLDSQMFRLKNSWGREWGNRGHAFISFDDMARLIQEQGEICLAVESVRAEKPPSDR